MDDIVDMIDNIDIDERTPSEMKTALQEMYSRLATIVGDMRAEIDHTCLDGNCE